MNKANAIFDKIEQVVKNRDSDEVFVMELTQDDGLDYVSDEGKLEVASRCECHASMNSMIKALLERLHDIRSTWNTVNKALDILQSITALDHFYQSSYVSTTYKYCKIKDQAPFKVKQARKDLLIKLSTGYAKVSRAKRESSNKSQVNRKTIDAGTHSKNEDDDDDFNDFISSEACFSIQSSLPISTQSTVQSSIGTTSNGLDDVLFFQNKTNNSMPECHSDFNFSSYPQHQNQSQFGFDTTPTQNPGLYSFGQNSDFSLNQEPQIASFAQTSFSMPQQQQHTINGFPQDQHQPNFSSQGFGVAQSMHPSQFPTQNNQNQPVMFNTLLQQENKNSLTYLRNHGKHTNPEKPQSLDDFMQETLRRV